MGFWSLKTRLWQLGRVSQWFEPRDIWIGYFHGEGAGYVVVIPMLPFRIEWGPRAAAG
jgi:hypothetical protein